ncbi:hypothetical protein CHS0354_028637 [Potamilus streckersoni]|uniref:Uncharacterized protein n=1 Tax=Potamilus streckersoni TaxID=2493646 RepID=A0AAE0W2Q1_9BIVA|nr:hypothetical protein CHS0354_028637 [Potamilus streckersoni]
MESLDRNREDSMRSSALTKTMLPLILSNIRKKRLRTTKDVSDSGITALIRYDCTKALAWYDVDIPFLLVPQFP